MFEDKKGGDGGFSIMEGLLVIAILSVVTSIVTYSLSNSRNNQNLKNGAVSVARTLVDARERTLAAKDQKSYGVHFDADRAVLFSGNSYTAGDLSNEVYLLDSALEIVSVALAGGGSDVKFTPLSAATIQSGSLVVRFKTKPSLKRTVTIYASGLVINN